MAARVKVWLLISLFALSACAVQQTTPVKRIALLAPFEGRYREVGYQALYAARMAIAETGRTDLELYAVDDGGSVQTAIDRAKALSNDPAVAIVLVMGNAATPNEVISAFRDDLPVIPVGIWAQEKYRGAWTDEEPFPTDITEIAGINEPYICGDVCMLTSFTALADDLSNVTVRSFASPVEDDFREKYINSDIFVPEPLPIAQYTYQVTKEAILIVNGTVKFPDLVNEFARWESDIYLYKYATDGSLQLVETQHNS